MECDSGGCRLLITSSPLFISCSMTLLAANELLHVLFYQHHRQALHRLSSALQKNTATYLADFCAVIHATQTCLKNKKKDVLVGRMVPLQHCQRAGSALQNTDIHKQYSHRHVQQTCQPKRGNAYVRLKINDEFVCDRYIYKKKKLVCTTCDSSTRWFYEV